MDVYKRVDGDGFVVHEMWFGDVASYVVMEHDNPRDWPMVANVFAKAFCNDVLKSLEDQGDLP